MSEIDTIQKRFENKVLNNLYQNLTGQYMLTNITLGDLANFAHITEKEGNEDPKKLQTSITSLVKSSGTYFGQLRQIMAERMFPAELETASKELMKKLELL